MGNGKTSTHGDSKSCHADDFQNERSFLQTRKQRRSRGRRKATNLSSRVFSRISTSSQSATRAEEIHLRDCISLGMMRSPDIESLSEASAQREGFDQTRDYFQRSFNSNEECRKYHNLYEEFQNQRASMVPRERQLTSCKISEAQY